MLTIRIALGWFLLAWSLVGFLTVVLVAKEIARGLPPPRGAVRAAWRATWASWRRRSARRQSARDARRLTAFWQRRNPTYQEPSHV